MLKNDWLNTFLLLLSLVSIANTQQLKRVNCPAINDLKVQSYGCGWIDYDSDGYLDLYINNPKTKCFLFKNNKDGMFTEVAGSPIIAHEGKYSGISWGDLDNDGLNDLVLTPMNGRILAYKNFGDGQFQQIPDSIIGLESGKFLSSVLFDYDNDGFLDLFIPSCPNLKFTSDGGDVNLLFHNNGNGHFTKVKAGEITTDIGNNTSAAFADIDNDGDPDLFAATCQGDNLLYENKGDGTFKKMSGGTINHNTIMSISCSWGDYDNDGFMDLFVGNGAFSQQKSYLFHNNGNKTFTKIAAGEIADYAAITWNGLWEDIDNDGYLDLYIANGTEPDAVFMNNGDGTFRKSSELDTTSYGSSGACFGDYDNDGFMDLFATNYKSREGFLYHNQGNGNHWITITCKGTESNKTAIGARVKIRTTIKGKPFWQIREITGNQGFRGVNDLRVHFGLGNATTIDSLIVQWPSKLKTIQTEISVDRFLTVIE